MHNKLFYEFACQMDVSKFISVNPEELQSEDSAEKATVLSQLQAENYDLAVNLNSHEFIGKLLPEIGAQRCIGFNSGDEYSENWLRFIMSFLKSREFSGFNLMDIYGWINIKYNPGKIKEVMIPRKPENVVIQLGSRNVKRQWRVSEFAVLTDWFVKQGAKVYLTGTASETVLSCKLLNTCSSKFNIIDMTGKTSVPALFKLIENADLLISGDTGTMHIGAFFGVPTIALFLGPAFPHETLSDSAIVTFPDSKVYDCYPCKEQDGCPYDLKCRDFTSAKDIIAFVERKLSKNWYYPASDSAGQLLKSYRETESDEKAIMRVIYRYIAKTELLNCTCEDLEIDKSTGAFRNIQNAIVREKQIFRHLIESKTKDFKFLNSLEYLKPLYLNYLLEKNRSDFVERAYELVDRIFS